MIFKIAALVIIIGGIIGLLLIFFKRSKIKKFLRVIIILFVIGLISGIGTYLYVFHKPHRNIAKEKPAYVLDAITLFSEFSTNEDSSYHKYGDKVLQVSGELVDISIQDNGANLTLLDPIEGINCALDSITVSELSEKLKSLSTGNEVTVKGKCDGYDMILGVVLTRCVLVN